MPDAITISLIAAIAALILIVLGGIASHFERLVEADTEADKNKPEKEPTLATVHLVSPPDKNQKENSVSFNKQLDL